MSRAKTLGATTWMVAGLAGFIGDPAAAQCDPEGFDGFATGTVMTTQIPGVIISAYPGTCGGGTPKAWIVAPVGGTISGSKALGIQTGCPDFSPDFLILDFLQLQHKVSFVVGEQAGLAGMSIRVRAYSSTGSLVSNQLVTTSGGTRTSVVVGSDSGPSNISWIEVEQTISLFETIDDLQFEVDTTPPIARIDEPTFITCACDIVAVVGEACDPDGDYGFDRLEYRKVNADGDPWTEIGSFTTPLCDGGTLYTWDSTTVSEGHYYLRLTVENACGLRSTAVTVVKVDRSAPHVNLSRPPEGAIVCGTIEIFGVSNDYDACDGDWELEVAPSGSGEWSLLADGVGDVSCTLAEWDTTTVTDGDYDIRLTGTNICGLVATDLQTVSVDNSAGCACTADINGDGVVDVSDLLILLASWTT